MNTLAQLVAAYNAAAATCGKPAVNRFSDRKTAERRTAEMIAAAAAIVTAQAAKVAPQTAYTPGTCPKCGDSANGITCGTVVDRKGGQVVINEHQAQCHVCGHEFNYDTGKPLRRASAAKDPAARAAKIAASWADPAVRAARVQRSAVTVDGTQHRSVCAAFEALGLPMSKHIAFRAELKAAGALEAFGKKWAVVVAG